MRIHTDQVGYLSNSDKKAVVVLPEGMKAEDVKLFVENAETGERTDIPVGVSAAVYDETAGEYVCRADITGLSGSGRYRIAADDGSVSPAFSVSGDVYDEALKSICKAFYFQRCGTNLPEEYAGVFKRPECHMEKAVLYTDNSVTLDVAGGWHDAGDFGRYPSAAATALGHLLYAYELFPEAFSGTLNIPESGNGIPDILNECRYELEFLLKMQDDEGGVYHKVTTLRHPEFIMPQDDHGKLYVFPVSSVATGSVAAVFCIASRIYEKYDPDLARRLVHAAVSAGSWLMEHKENVEFKNPEGVNTGEYDDSDDTDERLWAFVELARTDVLMENEYDHSEAGRRQNGTSRQEKYKEAVRSAWEKLLPLHDEAIEKQREITRKNETAKRQAPVLFDGFGWTDVSGLALLSALTCADACDLFGEKILSEMKRLFMEKAEIFAEEAKASGYMLAMQGRDFVWGSNMVVTNRAGILAAASVLSEDAGFKKECRDAALEQLHYIFGRNAMGISYVTGFGENAFRHPHNRVTECDGIEEPIPGEVSGGPCFPPLDPVGISNVPEGSAPQKCYVDRYESYSLNEITIYWNSSAVFTLAFAAAGEL